MATVCRFCAHANPADAKFCNACGAPLHLRPCPRCEAITDASAANCHQCGAPLDASQASGVPLRQYFPAKPRVEENGASAGNDTGARATAPAATPRPADPLPAQDSTVDTHRASIPESLAELLGADGVAKPGAVAAPVVHKSEPDDAVPPLHESFSAAMPEPDQLAADTRFASDIRIGDALSTDEFATDMTSPATASIRDGAAASEERVIDEAPPPAPSQFARPLARATWPRRSTLHRVLVAAAMTVVGVAAYFVYVRPLSETPTQWSETPTPQGIVADRAMDAPATGASEKRGGDPPTDATESVQGASASEGSANAGVSEASVDPKGPYVAGGAAVSSPPRAITESPPGNSREDASEQPVPTQAAQPSASPGKNAATTPRAASSRQPRKVREKATSSPPRAGARERTSGAKPPAANAGGDRDAAATRQLITRELGPFLPPKPNDRAEPAGPAIK